MIVFTKWVCYGGRIGVAESGDYYELASGLCLRQEVHAGALYYRAIASNKRYSWKKCNETKILKRIKIIELPF